MNERLYRRIGDPVLRWLRLVEEYSRWWGNQNHVTADTNGRSERQGLLPTGDESEMRSVGVVRPIILAFRAEDQGSNP